MKYSNFVIFVLFQFKVFLQTVYFQIPSSFFSFCFSFSSLVTSFNLLLAQDLEQLTLVLMILFLLLFILLLLLNQLLLNQLLLNQLLLHLQFLLLLFNQFTNLLVVFSSFFYEILFKFSFNFIFKSIFIIMSLIIFNSIFFICCLLRLNHQIIRFNIPTPSFHISLRKLSIKLNHTFTFLFLPTFYHSFQN